MKKSIKGAIQSSMACASNYDAVNESLFITFRNGSEYVYYKVPIITYIGLICCPSPGAYVEAYIKGVYSFRKVSVTEQDVAKETATIKARNKAVKKGPVDVNDAIGAC